MKTFKSTASRLALLLIAVFFSTITLSAQTTTFTYQGRLTDAGGTATAYDLQFTLYDETNAPVGASIVREDVTVTNGAFTVSLDFGAAAFSGSTRTLEIAVRRGTETGAFTTLTPRQPITSTPYAIKSLSAATATNATKAADFTGSLAGDVSGTQTATVVNSVGGQTAANVASGAQIANTATNANTANTVVRRDANGSFAASTVNAGNVVLASGGKVTFADGTQQSTSVDPSLFVVRNQQSGSILVEDFRLSVTKPAGNVEALRVTSPAVDAFLGGLIARFRSNSGTGTTTGPAVDRFRFDQAGGFVAIGQQGFGVIPATGCGVRMMWHPQRSAFRAGSTDDGGACSSWDETNIGFYSWAGGYRTIAKEYATFAFGEDLNVTGKYGAAFGRYNAVSGQSGFSAGLDNKCGGSFCAALGGINRADGQGSVAIGYRNSAVGDYSVALGQRARGGCVSGDNGCATPFSFSGGFIFGDASTTTTYFDATADNQFNVRASGGYRLFTTTDTTTSAAMGVSLSANGGAWNTISDRNAKENFSAVNSRDILRNVLKLPISTWNYKGQSYRHIGAMAQDFYRAFNVGESDKTITTIDPDGVALAAIQGLNEEMQSELKKRDEKIERQQKQLDELKQIVCRMKSDAAVCKAEDK